MLATIEFGTFITDVDNELSTLSITTDSDYITVKALQLDVLYDKGKPGNSYVYPVNITVNDHIATVTTLVNFTVIPVDDVPSLKAIPARTTDEDVPLTFTLTPYASDEEDPMTTLVWSATDGSNMVDDGNGNSVPLVTSTIGKSQNQAQITITPAPNQWGNDEVTVTVKDSYGHTVSEVIKITITEMNDAPTVLPIPDQTIPENEHRTLDLSNYLFDVDNTKGELTLWSESKWVKTRKDLKVEAYFPVGEFQGAQHKAKIWARDPVGAETAFEIVFNVTKNPTIDTEIPMITVEAGKTKTIPLSSYANDDRTLQDLLKWSVSIQDTKYFTAVIKDGNILEIKGKKAGQEDLVLNVTDTDGGSDSQIVGVEVTGSTSGLLGANAAQSANLFPLILLMIVLVGMVVAVGGMKVKMKRDRIARIKSARDARKAAKAAQQAAGPGVSTAGTSLATRDEVAAPMQMGDPLGLGIPMQAKGPKKPAPMCFACGTQTVLMDNKFHCPKCGRIQS
jgi:hypothetical protein